MLFSLEGLWDKVSHAPASLFLNLTTKEELRLPINTLTISRVCRDSDLC